MSDTTVTAFLGDRDRAFDLTPQVIELERVTGTGIGALIRRVIAGDFHATDMPEIVRLGLIGGGEKPKDAAALVAAYVTGRPLAETHQLATLIALALWNGVPKVAEAKVPEDELPGGFEIRFPDGRVEIVSGEAA
ncbi:gene transfer agent family protein [Methylorubrum sp. Q1]|uniref:gene transfer agent family protein n=1 Tax=Methylorubrum sp. Q1 TaxID=2562453 RepID=UPI00107687BF|nr:gene transfer agent family protein [Methylorubrum sp. Q1]TFZ55916.1 gene transfer agent family protein [Methylorubrum sp. Q1]